MRYAELISLARRDSDAGRAGLIENLANLYLDSPEEPGEVESKLFGEITERLMKTVASDICGRVAERLADSGRTPHELAVNLARSDRHEVFKPILARSKVLTDADLVQLIGELDEDHTLAVVDRPKLSSEVTDALIDTGYSSVQRRVSSHEGAAFSQEGLERLISAAMDDEILFDNLANRSPAELEEDSAQFFRRLKAAMLKVLGPGCEFLQIEQEFSQERVAEFTRRLFKEVGLEMDSRREAQILSSNIEDGQVSIDAAITGLAEAIDHKMICQLIANVLGVPLRTVQKAYANADSVVISMLCHALNLSLNSYSAMTKLRAIQIPAVDYGAVVSKYRNLDRRESQRMLRIIKLNADQL